MWFMSIFSGGSTVYCTEGQLADNYVTIFPDAGGLLRTSLITTHFFPKVNSQISQSLPGLVSLGFNGEIPSWNDALNKQFQCSMLGPIFLMKFLLVSLWINLMKVNH